MNAERSNIVQAEFFLSKAARKGNLDALLYDCALRAADGVNIKEGIRMYDTDGSITSLIAGAQAAEEHAMSLWALPTPASHIQRLIRGRVIGYQRSRASRLKENARIKVLEKLQNVLKTSEQIAIERGAHEYTLAQRDELHELIEAVSKSSGVWFFIFKPNELTADKNEPIAHTM